MERHLLHGLTPLARYRRSVADLQAKFEAATTASTAARAEVQRLEARLAGLKKEQRRLERCKAVAKEESKVNELVWEINELVEEIDEVSRALAHASVALQEATTKVSYHTTALAHNHEAFLRAMDALQGARLV